SALSPYRCSRSSRGQLWTKGNGRFRLKADMRLELWARELPAPRLVDRDMERRAMVKVVAIEHVSRWRNHRPTAIKQQSSPFTSVEQCPCPQPLLNPSLERP